MYSYSDTTRTHDSSSDACNVRWQAKDWNGEISEMTGQKEAVMAKIKVRRLNLVALVVTTCTVQAGRRELTTGWGGGRTSKLGRSGKAVTL